MSIFPLISMVLSCVTLHTVAGDMAQSSHNFTVFIISILPHFYVFRASRNYLSRKSPSVFSTCSSACFSILSDSIGTARIKSWFEKIGIILLLFVGSCVERAVCSPVNSYIRLVIKLRSEAQFWRCDCSI